MPDSASTPRAAWWRADIHGPHEVEWSMSPGIYEMHGADPAGDLHGLALIRSGQGEDGGALGDSAAKALAAGDAFAHRRRLHRADGSRDVLAVGVGEHAEDGRLVAVNGFIVDIGALLQESISTEVTVQLTEIVAARARIDQAKGGLMLALGIDDDAAFALMGFYSQRTNTRVRDLAERVSASLSVAPDDPALLDAHLSRAMDARASELPLTAAPLRTRRTRPTVVGQRVDGVLTITVTGDLDLVSTTVAGTALREAMQLRGTRLLLVQLGGVGYLSPVAAVALTGVVTRAGHHGVETRVLAGEHAETLRAAGLPAEALAG